MSTPDSQPFSTSCGLRQGGVESPPLFNLWIDVVLRIFTEQCREQGIGMDVKFSVRNTATTRAGRMEARPRGTHTMIWVAYADDVIITCTTREQLQKALNILHSLFTDFNLTICCRKTQTMVLNWQGDESDYPNSFA